MILDRVSSGKNVPNDVNVVIEIPSHSDPIKYEVDKVEHCTLKLVHVYSFHEEYEHRFMCVC
ncbi:MAG: hypothetical protein AAF353_10250, partial [Pseudomonadota bacterium]